MKIDTSALRSKYPISVKTHLCKLRVVLRPRVLRGVYALVKHLQDQTTYLRPTYNNLQNDK